MNSKPKLPIGRYAVRIEVYDNRTKRPIVDEAYDTDSPWLVRRDLEEAARKMDGR